MEIRIEIEKRMFVFSNRGIKRVYIAMKVTILALLICSSVMCGQLSGQQVSEDTEAVKQISRGVDSFSLNFVSVRILILLKFPGYIRFCV